MFKRVMVAVVGIPFLLLVLIWAPAWATMVLIAAMCAIAAWELLHAAGALGRGLTVLTILTAALGPVAASSSRDGPLRNLIQCFAICRPGIISRRSMCWRVCPIGRRSGITIARRCICTWETR